MMISNFFRVIVQSRSYLNILYLMLTFPLGIFYFTILITGISLGIGLAITLLGIPILFGTLLLWRLFAYFEIELARIILGIKIKAPKVKKTKNFWEWIKSYLVDSFTWKSLAYLFIQFPIGIFSFVILTVSISVSISFISIPILYHLLQIGAINGVFLVGPFIFANSYWFTLLVGILGIFMLFVSLHLFNGLSRIFGAWTKFMLGKK